MKKISKIFYHKVMRNYSKQVNLNLQINKILDIKVLPILKNSKTNKIKNPSQN
jgi:hypothetical protein